MDSKDSSRKDAVRHEVTKKLKALLGHKVTFSETVEQIAEEITKEPEPVPVSEPVRQYFVGVKSSFQLMMPMLMKTRGGLGTVLKDEAVRFTRLEAENYTATRARAMHLDRLLGGKQADVEFFILHEKDVDAFLGIPERKFLVGDHPLGARRPFFAADLEKFVKTPTTKPSTWTLEVSEAKRFTFDEAEKFAREKIARNPMMRLSIVREGSPLDCYLLHGVAAGAFKSEVGPHGITHLFRKEEEPKFYVGNHRQAFRQYREGYPVLVKKVPSYPGEQIEWTSNADHAKQFTQDEALKFVRSCNGDCDKPVPRLSIISAKIPYVVNLYLRKGAYTSAQSIDHYFDKPIDFDARTNLTRSKQHNFKGRPSPVVYGYDPGSPEGDRSVAVVGKFEPSYMIARKENRKLYGSEPNLEYLHAMIGETDAWTQKEDDALKLSETRAKELLFKLAQKHRVELVASKREGFVPLSVSTWSSLRVNIVQKKWSDCHE